MDEAVSKKDAVPDDEGSCEVEPNAGSELSEEEESDVEDRSRLRSRVVFEIIRKEGEEEMRRPLSSLWWSGIAAGLSIGLSVVTEGLLIAHLTDGPLRTLLADFGYCVGFLIVILARQQLFTENTITAVLPLMQAQNLRSLNCMVRLWVVVFAANMAGTFLFALFCIATNAFGDQVHVAMLEMSRTMMANGWLDMFFKAIVAGWLIAGLVWILPNAEGSEFVVITLMTYIISIAKLTHIIAGSVEGFLLVLNGDLAATAMFIHFIVPVLLGNVFGGTALFSLVAYAQVKAEI